MSRIVHIDPKLTPSPMSISAISKKGEVFHFQNFLVVSMRKERAAATPISSEPISSPGLIGLTLSGPSEARMTKLTAANRKPLILWCPNFLTFIFYPKDIFWSNFSKIDQSGGCCCSFLIEAAKMYKMKKFSSACNCWNWHGSQFWVEKNGSGHKNSFS